MDMKKSILICSLVIMGIFLTLTSGCKKGSNENNPSNDFSGTDGTFLDSRDHNTYKWIKIGAQIWMAQNLNFSLSTESWYYSSNSSLGPTYGRLYTYDAALLAIPEGWHLPSLAELNTLITYLGGIDVAGGKMKQSGTTNWLTPNTAADNSSGFNALPGGMFDPGNGFYSKGIEAFFWASFPNYGGNMGYYWLSNNDAILHTDTTDPAVGNSVRCIKN